MAELLAATRPAQVITPVHPGFAGTSRPETLSTVRDLANMYLSMLEAMEMRDVTVVGSSLGGWIAADMAAQQNDRVSKVILIDAVGLEVPGHPITDLFSLAPNQVASYTFADPQTHSPDPLSLPDEVRASIPGNIEALKAYAGVTMADPTLRTRLASAVTPTLVIWGEEDRIAPIEIGYAYADAIPGATLELIPNAGHLPQIEAADRVAELVWSFASSHAGPAKRPIA
jgi:pimeloyl-ACP methyl ester carboxylesterase